MTDSSEKSLQMLIGEMAEHVQSDSTFWSLVKKELEKYHKSSWLYGYPVRRPIDDVLLQTLFAYETLWAEAKYTGKGRKYVSSSFSNLAELFRDSFQEQADVEKYIPEILEHVRKLVKVEVRLQEQYWILPSANICADFQDIYSYIEGWLESEDSDRNYVATFISNCRYDAPTDFQKRILGFLHPDTPGYLLIESLKFFRHYKSKYDQLDEDIFGDAAKKTASLLKHTDADIRWNAIKFFEAHSDMSLSYRQEIADLVDDGDAEVKEIADRLTGKMKG